MDDDTPSHDLGLFILDNHTISNSNATTLALPSSTLDPEARGRKRRRDPFGDFALARPLRDSSTLRGRGRHRSPMWMHLLPPRCGSSSTRIASTANSRQHAAAGKVVMQGESSQSALAASVTASASSLSDKNDRNNNNNNNKMRVLGVVFLRPDEHMQSQPIQHQQRRRRSQSPSRSQSPMRDWSKTGTAVLARGRRARRRRTASRSRRHELGDEYAVLGEVGAEAAVAAAVRSGGSLG
ncbi:hypothetical protein BD289DRAFT_479039 [Coniella lustricola]|uniref:Uncharacterized protein n=1 Tax=Coniella lustricola TaxID=2025994 RepID=A0A2T3AKN0_9PEZI|nr:hypothetical protein BD289DRAFT_479039 [Coniella lustricola]